MEQVEIITLTPNDWEQYKHLRLRALQEEPQAYGSSYKENAEKPSGFWREKLSDALEEKTQWLVFAKLGAQLVGMVGAYVAKEPDNACVIGVYVAPEARGKGIARLLMNDLLRRLKSSPLIKKITVEVNSEQKVAFNLYKSLGFVFVEEYKEVLGDGKEHDVFDLQMING